MAQSGAFDPALVSVAWFDETGQPIGWFDRQLVDQPPASGGITADASITEGADTLAATASMTIAGAASIQESGDTVSSTASLTVTAAAALAESADTLSSAGVLIIVGASSITEAADTAAATASVLILLDASFTESPDTLDAALAGSGIVADADIQESGDILSAAASFATPVSTRTRGGGSASRTDNFHEIAAARLESADAELMQLTAMVVTYLITEDLI